MKILKGNRLMLFDDGKLAIRVRIRRLFFAILRYAAVRIRNFPGDFPAPEQLWQSTVSGKALRRNSYP